RVWRVHHSAARVDSGAGQCVSGRQIPGTGQHQEGRVREARQVGDAGRRGQGVRGMGERGMTSVIRWGILGTAHIGRSLPRASGDARDNCIQAVASREWTRASEWAREFGVPRVFGSYDELLTSGEVNAIYNPLPNSLHGEWTI